MKNYGKVMGVVIIMVVMAVAVSVMPLAWASSYQGILRFSVSADEYHSVSGGMLVRFGFHIENHSDNDVNLTFSTPYKYNVEIDGIGFHYTNVSDHPVDPVVETVNVPAQGKAYLGMEWVTLPYGVYEYHANLGGHSDIYQDGYILVVPGNVYIIRLSE